MLNSTFNPKKQTNTHHGADCEEERHRCGETRTATELEEEKEAQGSKGEGCGTSPVDRNIAIATRLSKCAP